MTKKLVVAALLFLAASVSVGCTSAEVSLSRTMFDSYRNKSVAVIDVTAPASNRLAWTVLVAGRLDINDSSRMLIALERNLLHQGYFEVVDASRLKRIMDEKGIRAPELVDTNLAVQLGRATGLDGIIVLQSSGSVSWLWPYSELNYRATAKLVDVETGKIVWSAEGTHGAPSIVPFQLFDTAVKHVYDNVAAEIVAETSAQYQARKKAAREAQGGGI